ncbi:hypothetical protein MXB_641, partial [Myxobolus squamalis]
MQATRHSKKIISDFSVHFRQLVTSSLDEFDDIIGWPSMVVELDERKFSKRKYYQEHYLKGSGYLEVTKEPKDCGILLLKLILTF